MLPSARKVILFSYIALFCIYGDMYIGTGSGNNSVTLFGVQIFGITQKNFWIFLFIANIYCASIFMYFVIRSGKIAGSWSLFIDITFKRLNFYSRSYITIFRRFLEKSIIKSKNPFHEETNMDDETLVSKELEQISEDQRENLLLIGDHRVLGFLEYFFAPIIFPASLSLWALIMLVIQVFC